MTDDDGRVAVPFTEPELTALYEAVEALLPDVAKANEENPHLLRAFLRLGDGMHVYKMRAEEAAWPPLRLVD